MCPTILRVVVCQKLSYRYCLLTKHADVKRAFCFDRLLFLFLTLSDANEPKPRLYPISYDYNTEVIYN